MLWGGYNGEAYKQVYIDRLFTVVSKLAEAYGMGLSQ